MDFHKALPELFDFFDQCLFCDFGLGRDGQVFWKKTSRSQAMLSLDLHVRIDDF